MNLAPLGITRSLYVIVGKPMRVPVVGAGGVAVGVDDEAGSKGQRIAAKQLTTELHAELQRLFDLAQARAGN